MTLIHIIDADDKNTLCFIDGNFGQIKSIIWELIDRDNNDDRGLEIQLRSIDELKDLLKYRKIKHKIVKVMRIEF